MMNIGVWFHKLFNPHCHVCKVNDACPNCANYIDLIAAEKREKKELIELLLKKDVPVVHEASVGMQPPIGKRGWYDIKRELEMNAHKKALEENEKYNESIKSTEELEKELIND